MSPTSPLARRLYLRIWLAVAASLAVFALIVGYAWRVAAEHNAQRLEAQPGRELQLLAPDGRVLLQGLSTRVTGEPEAGLQLRIEAEDGQSYRLRLAPRERAPGHERRGAAFWLRPPYGFAWTLALAGLAVSVALFPIIRRLLQRLEQLERSVQRFGEGDLSARVHEQGHDEVARLAQRFNASAARIEALVASHKSLLANASHELRSPLTRIRMGLELLHGSTDLGAARAEIERNIAELDQLVDEILLASRLDAGAFAGDSFESVDLLGLAAEECARVDAELSAGSAGSSGSDDGAQDMDGAGGPLEVHGDARLLRRALRNLLENARRYSQGEVTLHIARVADTHGPGSADGAGNAAGDVGPTPGAATAAPAAGAVCVLQVCDHGPGVPPAQRERIFEPFYRLPGASERAGGVGLGLALVRSIAQRHGGSVQCTARPDGQTGACFVLRLPVQAGPAPAFAPGAPGDPASAGGMGAAASSRA
ncbi:ATP-binding protein [Melaminivora jejuensis]|uniref:ATP-binding protein n=1 Tax=Melaminivora jejuensis TaxID=1267217 RepID=UPI001E47B523|nr:ATP-binding protein [Melaminivora jejuensis]UHJ66528.1 ATP-binding protein [Melaminivora jejuensis]